MTLANDYTFLPPPKDELERAMQAEFRRHLDHYGYQYGYDAMTMAWGWYRTGYEKGRATVAAK
jgi:tRNA-dihydrouridine synthase